MSLEAGGSGTPRRESSLSTPRQMLRDTTLKTIKVGTQIKRRATHELNPVHFHKDDKTGKKHILHYNPDTLFNFGFISPRGSVLSWGMGFRILIMCGAGTLVSQYRCAAAPTHYSFCFPIIPPAEGLIFASLVTFLLGLFVTTTFSRWWTVRENLGIIMNNAGVMTMLLGNVPAEPRFHNHAKKIFRYMHLGHALTYKLANKNTDFSDLLKYDLATPEEIDFFNQNKNANLAVTVFGWAMRTLAPLIEAGALSWGTSTAAISSIQACYFAVNGVNGLLNTQMPYSYLHLLTLTTKIHLSFIVFYAGGIIASGIVAHQWNRILLGYTVIITNYLIYEGLLIIHNVLVNPLGDDAGDFPTALYVANNYELTLAMQAPAPVEESPDAPKDTLKEI